MAALKQGASGAGSIEKFVNTQFMMLGSRRLREVKECLLVKVKEGETSEDNPRAECWNMADT